MGPGATGVIGERISMGGMCGAWEERAQDAPDGDCRGGWSESGSVRGRVSPDWRSIAGELNPATNADAQRNETLREERRDAEAGSVLSAANDGSGERGGPEQHGCAGCGDAAGDDPVGVHGDGAGAGQMSVLVSRFPIMCGACSVSRRRVLTRRFVAGGIVETGEDGDEGRCVDVIAASGFPTDIPPTGGSARCA